MPNFITIINKPLGFGLEEQLESENKCTNLIKFVFGPHQTIT
jgi:hypothetical protein